MSELSNRQVVLRRRPVGLVAAEDVEMVEVDAPELADGEALVRTTYVGIDAAVRTWLDGQGGYLPALELGDPLRGAVRDVDHDEPLVAHGDDPLAVRLHLVGLVDAGFLVVGAGAGSNITALYSDRSSSHRLARIIHHGTC